MKFTALVLLATLLSARVAIADDNTVQRGADLIAQASDKMNIFALLSFEMKANVRIDIKGNSVDGSYWLLWNGPEQWKEEISFPGYSEIQVGSKGIIFIKRSTDFLPLRIYQLHSVLGYGSEESTLDQSSFFSQAPRPHETIKEVHERMIDGVKAECVEIAASGKHTREACVDQTTGTLIRTRFHDKGLMTIGSKLFPGSMAWIEDGRSFAEVQITELKTGEKLPASLFDPPAGAISRAGCMNPVPGRLVHKVDPQYPIEDRFSHISGTVAVYAVIDKAGVPQGLQIVSTVNPSLDKASLDATRKWRYEPDTCGGSPVDTETVIEIHFVLAH